MTTTFQRACEAAFHAESEHEGRNSDGCHFDSGGEGDKLRLMSMVRAVLQAIREPDRPPIDAGAKAVIDVTEIGKPDQLSALIWAQHSFRAMIDSILSEAGEREPTP